MPRWRHAASSGLVAACCLVGVALMNHRPVEDESIKSEEQQYQKVAAKNAWLEKQDHQLKSQVRGAAIWGEGREFVSAGCRLAFSTTGVGASARYAAWDIRAASSLNPLRH